MSNLKVFEVFDGGEPVWAIAEDPEKARAISREYLRDSARPEDYEEDELITELPMDHSLTIHNEEGPEPFKETMTCAEWIADQGEGFLCTTCY